jgi:hypothetical protein
MGCVGRFRPRGGAPRRAPGRGSAHCVHIGALGRGERRRGLAPQPCCPLAPTAMPSSRASRAPASSPSAMPMSSSAPAKRVVRLATLRRWPATARKRPGAGSGGPRRRGAAHARSATASPCQGRSARHRSYRLWTRSLGQPQARHAAVARRDRHHNEPPGLGDKVLDPDFVRGRDQRNHSIRHRATS